MLHLNSIWFHFLWFTIFLHFKSRRFLLWSHLKWRIFLFFFYVLQIKRNKIKIKENTTRLPFGSMNQEYFTTAICHLTVYKEKNFMFNVLKERDIKNERKILRINFGNHRCSQHYKWWEDLILFSKLKNEYKHFLAKNLREGRQEK